MNSKGISNTKDFNDRTVQNFDKANYPNQSGKQRLQIDISSIQKNNYIHQQNNHFNLSLDMGLAENAAGRAQVKQYQTGLNRSYIEGEGYNSQNDNSLIMGRKIENQNNLIISGSSTTQNQNIRKFPIPVDLMKTKKKNRSNSRGRASKLSNQDESMYLDAHDIDIIQTEQNYMTQPHNQARENQRQLYYQSNMRANNISLNEYDDAEDIIQMNSILTQQKANSKSTQLHQQPQSVAGSKSMKAVSSGSMNIHNRSLSPQSNNTHGSHPNQGATAANDNQTAFFGQVKKIKKVGGVLKVVKKAKTPKKKSKSKEPSSKNATRKEQKQDKPQGSNSFLFQNKAIQDASYAIHNNEEGFDDQFEMNNHFLEEFNSEKEFSEKCENISNAAIDYQNHMQGGEMGAEGEMWNQQNQEEYVRMMQNITNQEDLLNNKNSGRQTTFSFRGKGRNSQTPSSRQKKKKRSSSRNNEQTKVSKSRSKSRQRAMSSQGMHRDGRSSSASKLQQHNYNAQEIKKIRVTKDFSNVRCVSQNTNKGKSSPSNKNQLMSEEKCREVQQMILNNIKQKQREELLKKRNDEEENYKRALKKKENQQKNTDIRQMNAQKINVVKRGSEQNFPWGMDQNKLKQKKEKSRERSVKEFSPSKSRTEKDRRKEMGLQFLNNLSQDEIEKLIQNHKVWYNQLMLQNKENKKELTLEEQQKIHFFMQLQKKQKKRQAEKDEALQRIKNVKKNLENLNQLVKEQRSKSSQRQRPGSNNQGNQSLILNISNANMKKENSSGNIEIENPFVRSENDKYKDSFEDSKFDFIQSQYKKLIQKEIENQNINDKSLSFNLTNNSNNNRSFQINYYSKKSISNQNSHNNTNIILNPNNIIINNNTHSTKSNGAIKPPSNENKTHSKTAYNSNGHSRNNSNLNNSVLGTHKRSQSRGAVPSNKHSDNQAQGDDNATQKDQTNTIDYLQEKKKQLKQQYSMISDRLKRQREEKKVLKQQQQFHNQSFAHGEDVKEHISNMAKFTDHSFSFNTGVGNQNNSFISHNKPNVSVSNKNLQQEGAPKQKIDRPASSQVKQRSSDSNHIPAPKQKEGASKNFIPQRHSDIVAGPGGSSRQSNYNQSTPTSSLGFSRPQSKLSDKKQKKKQSTSKDVANTSQNNISINKSGKKKKTKTTNNQNASSKPQNNQNQFISQEEKSPERASVSNTISINNNFSYNINFEMLQQLKQKLSAEQISNLTQEELHDLELRFLEQQQKMYQYSKQHPQHFQRYDQVHEEEDAEYDEEEDQNEYEDHHNHQNQPYYEQNQFIPQDYDLSTSQNHVRQLYENYDEEDDMDPNEVEEDEINGHLIQTNQIYKAPYPNQYPPQVNLSQQQQQISETAWDKYLEQQHQAGNLNPLIYQNQIYYYDENTQQYYYQNIPPQQLQKMQIHSSHTTHQEQSSGQDIYIKQHDQYDEDEEGKYQDEEDFGDEVDDEQDQDFNAHEHIKEEQIEKVPEVMNNNNVDEPFEIEELDTSNFTEKGNMQSTINNEERKSQQSSQRSEQELNISEMRRIEQEYQELLSKQPNVEKSTTFKNRMSLNTSLMERKERRGQEQQNISPIPEQIVTSAKKEAARVIIRCLKELKTRRVVTRAFKRYFQLNYSHDHELDEHHYEHDASSDQLNEGMQVYTERNDSVQDSHRNPNDARLNILNLQTSNKNKSQSHITTPQSGHNQTYNNTENFKNMKEITSTIPNNKINYDEDEDDINFNKMLLGNSNSMNSKANRAIDDYSLNEEDDFAQKSSGVNTSMKNKKENEQNIKKELSVEEIPFSKYGFIKQENNSSKANQQQQQQQNIKGKDSSKQQSNSSSQLQQNKGVQPQQLQNQYDHDEEDEDLEIQDEHEFDQILFDLHQQAIKSQQLQKQDKSSQGKPEGQSNKTSNIQSQYSSVRPNNKAEIGSKLQQIEKVINTNPTDDDNNDLLNERESANNKKYNFNKSSEYEDESTRKRLNEDEEDEYSHLNKNKYKSEIKREQDQMEESSADKDYEQEMLFRQQQRNQMKSRIQNYQQGQDEDDDQQIDMDDYADDYDPYGQESFQSSQRQGSQQDPSSQRNNDQKNLWNSQKDNKKQSNNVFDDYLDQSLSENNKNESSKQSSKQLSKPNSSEELIELLAKQQFKKPQQLNTECQTQTSKSATNDGQQIKNIKKKPQLNLSIKSNDQNFDVDDTNYQDVDQTNSKNANSKPKKPKIDDNLISELGINDEWSNQKKKTNEKNLYETDMQVLGGSSNEMFDNQMIQNSNYQRHNFLMTSGALDTQKLNNLIAGGQQRYQMSSEDKKYQEFEEQQGGGVHELVGINDPQQNNTLQFKEINEYQRSLVTVKEFDKSDFLDMTKGTTNLQSNSANNKKRRDRSSTEFLREKLNDELSKIDAIPEISNTFISENSEHQSGTSSAQHSRQPSYQNNKNIFSQNQSQYQESSQRKSHSSSVNTVSKSMVQQYETEISKIKEEEAIKWNQMIALLNNLQNQGSIPKEAADQMKMFSEMNKKYLENNQLSKNNSELREPESFVESSFLLQSSAKKVNPRLQVNSTSQISQVEEVDEKLISIESNNSQKYGGKSDNQGNQRQKKESPFKFDLPQPYEKQQGTQNERGQQINKHEEVSRNVQSGDKGQKQQRKRDLKIDVDKITESYNRNEGNLPEQEEGRAKEQGENNTIKQQNTNNSNQLTTNSNLNNLSRNNNNTSEDKIRFEEDFLNHNNSSSNATNTQKNLTSGSDQTRQGKQQGQPSVIGKFRPNNEKAQINQRMDMNFYDDEDNMQDQSDKQITGGDEQSVSSCTSPSVSNSMVQKHLMRVHTNSTDGEDSVRGSNDHQIRSIFEINSFGEQFDNRKMKEILQMEKIDHIFDYAQQALNVRKEAKNKKLQSMFDKQRISPKSFYRKQQELEKWVSKEQQSIEKTKLRMQKTILSTEETIKKTQRDIEFSKQMKKKAVISSNSYKNLLPNQDFDIYRVSLSEEDDHMNSSASSSHRYYHHHHHPHPQQIPDPTSQQNNRDLQKYNKKQQQHDILGAACTPDSASSNNIKVIDDFDCSSSYDQQSQHIFAQLQKTNNTNKSKNNQNQLPHTGAAQSLVNSSGSSGNNLSNINVNNPNVANNNNNTSSSSSLRKLSKDKSQHQLQNLDEASNQTSQKSFQNAGSQKNSKESDPRFLTEEERKNLQFEKKKGVSSSSSTKRNINSSPEQFQEDDFESLHSSIQESSHNSLPSHTNRKTFDNKSAEPQASNIQINNKNQDISIGKNRFNSQDNTDKKYIDESSKNFLNSISNSSDLIQQRKGSLNRSGSHQPSQQTSSIETIEEHELPLTNKQVNTKQQSNQPSTVTTNPQSKANSDKKYLQYSDKSSLADPRSVEKTLSKQSEDQEVDISGEEDLNQSIEWEDDLPQPKRGGVVLQKTTQNNGDNLVEDTFDYQNDFLGDHKSGNFYQKQMKQYSVQQNPSIMSVQSVSNNNSAVSAAPHFNNNLSQVNAAPHPSVSQNFLKLSNAKSDRSDLIYSTSKDIENISEIYLTAEKDTQQQLQEIKEVSDEMVLLNNNPTSDLNIHEMELLDESASQLYQENYQRRNRSDSDPSRPSDNINVGGGDFIVPDAQKGVNGGFIKLSNLINQYNPTESLTKAPLQKVSPSQSESESNDNLPVVQTQSQCLKIEDQMHENEPKQLGNNTKSHYMNKFEIDQEDEDEDEEDLDDDDLVMRGDHSSQGKSSQLNQAQQKHLQEESLNEQQNQYIQQQKLKQQNNNADQSGEPQEKEAENVVNLIMNDLLKEAFDEVQGIQQKRRPQNQNSQAEGGQRNNQQIAQINQRTGPRQLQGFKTNLNTVKEYIINVSTHIQNDGDYKTKFLTHINTWLGPQPEELLKLLHMYDGSQEDQLDTSDESSYSTQPILDGKLYADIERKRNVQPSQDSRDNLIKTLERIHNKAIFEAFNEALDYQRMYGLRGKPFPWKITHEKISEKPHNPQDIPKILQKASEKVVEWSSSLCGIIVDKEDSHFQPGIHLDEDYLQQIKEDRLNRMLSAEVIENEEKWILYDEEQTEVQVELSQMVFDLLIYEACNEFRKISINQVQHFNELNNNNNQ